MAGSTAHSDVLIAIVGAGPGGLLVASYLQSHLPPSLIPYIKVFESDESRATRAQGGTLDLHTDTGLYALKSVGLIPEFQKKMRPGGEEMRVVDALSGEVLLAHDGFSNEGQRPEIDRTDLRDILLDSLLPETVQFGHRLHSVTPSPSSASWSLTFRRSLSSDTTTVNAQILIGADGAWSKIRPLLTPARPVYTGLTFLDMEILPSTLVSQPQLADYVGQGMAIILSGTNRGVLPQRNTNGTIKVYASFKEDESWLDEHPLDADDDKRREQIRSWFPGYSPKVLALLDAADMRSIVPRKIFAMPPDLMWTRPIAPGSRGNSKGAGGIVTLLGDSAHVMSPMAGEGVNQALRDAVELGMALSKVLRSAPEARAGPQGLAAYLPNFLVGTSTFTLTSAPVLTPSTLGSLNRAIAKYENLMFRRAKQAALESAYNFEQFFHPDAPGTVVEMFKSFAPPPFGPGLIRWAVRMFWTEGWKWAEREGWW